MNKDSSPYDPIRKEYADLASSYDEKWRFYNETTTKIALEQLEVAGTEQVLDVCCGTGNLIFSLLERWPHLACYGLDLSPEMLGVARAKSFQRNVRLRLLQGSAESLPFGDSSFDLLVCCNSLHFVSMPGQALSEFRRVIRPEGGLLVIDWCHDYLSCRVCGFVLRLIGKEHGHLLGSKEFSALLKGSGFPLCEVRTFKINLLWGLMVAKAHSDLH